jgi:hypothetical protein
MLQQQLADSRSHAVAQTAALARAHEQAAELKASLQSAEVSLR